jgi:hypothetical protein
MHSWTGWGSSDSGRAPTTGAVQRAGAAVPRPGHGPAGSQDVGRTSLTLGTSVGWIDRYPSTYYEQYVDVTGLIGRFAFVMRADPDNELAELSDANNAAWVLVSLPTR